MNMPLKAICCPLLIYRVKFKQSNFPRSMDQWTQETNIKNTLGGKFTEKNTTLSI